MLNILFIVATTLLFSDKTLTPPTDAVVLSPAAKVVLDPVKEQYEQMNLEGIVHYEAFEQALQGYTTLKVSKKNILTIIDFTLPSTDKRMVVLDMKDRKILYHTIVSHGRNSGEKYATSFSNKHGSFQSSLGFFVTQNTYFGGNGYSLVIDGLEQGINDQAKARAVVIHGADYASEAVIKSSGRLGRSYGCPALPRELNKPIINTIKEGSLVYIYAAKKDYLAQTKIVKAKPSSTMLAQQHTDPQDKQNNVL